LTVALPTDGHVHSEWSWDAPDGSMELTCARAVDLGLPAVAFTEHADYTTWIVPARDLEEHEHLKAFATPDGSLAPPKLDLEGYLECVQRCRDKFRNLRIITGLSWVNTMRPERVRR
jgi:histidinol-phosphatase (PHP family)